MEAGRPLFIPVILGTARMGRMSLHAAKLVTRELGKCAGVETGLIDIAGDQLTVTGLGDEGTAFYRETLSAADLTPRAP